METTRSSTHRASMTAHSPQSQHRYREGPPGGPPLPEHDPLEKPPSLRDRTITATGLPEAPRPASGTDYEKVAKNAAASAVALGSCFGTMSALNNAVRAVPGMPVPVKVLTGLLPSASVFPTPWVEDGVRAALDTTATLPTRPSLAHDAVAAATLFGFNAACARSTRIPRFPAATPAGMAATVLQATAASVLSGAASEASAQWMNERDRQDGVTHAAPEPMDNWRKGSGRLLSQVAAAGGQTALAFRETPLPPARSLLPMTAVTWGWSLRRVLAPPVPSSARPPVDPPPVSAETRAAIQAAMDRWPEIPPG